MVWFVGLVRPAPAFPCWLALERDDSSTLAPAEECKKNLAEAIALILEDQREDMLRGLTVDARREVITIE